MNNNDIAKDVKNKILNDTMLCIYIYIYLIKKEKGKDFNLEETLTYYYLLLSDSEEDLKNIKSLLDECLNYKLLDETLNFYRNMATNEGIKILYSLSRLLYLQNKYKDQQLGEKIDQHIKKWVKLINDSNGINNYIKTKTEQNDNIENIADDLTQMEAYRFYNDITFLCIGVGVRYINNIDFFKNYKEQDQQLTLCEDLNQAIDSYISRADEFYRYNVYIYTDKSNNNDKYEDLKPIQQRIFNDSGFYIQSLKDYTIPKEEEANKNIWENKTNKFIDYLEKLGKSNLDLNKCDINNVIKHLSFNTYQRKTYKVHVDSLISIVSNETQEKDEAKLLQATSKQLKAIDNVRGSLVTYNETDTQTIKNTIKEKEESLRATTIKKDKEQLKKDIKELKEQLKEAESKEEELKTEYKNVCDYLKEIIKSMANENKTSTYYKTLKKRKKEQEQRKKEIERIMYFNGWQLDIFGNGSYELTLNKRKQERLKLTVENLNKQVAKYTKEEQDLFDFLINKYLHNTNKKEIDFTLREYEKVKGRARADKQLISDIQASRLLFREVWTYYTTDTKTFKFSEEHLFTKLNIQGETVTDTTSLENIGLDTQISLEPTETLQRLLQDHDNYLYIATPMEVLQLNNDGEYLAKRLIKYFCYLARVNGTSEITISLDEIIEELQYYGLKPFNFLDRHHTYKTEIIDRIDKQLKILEGDNHLNKKFIEVTDLSPFINYDDEFRGKKQETIINEWGKQKITLKVFNIDDNKLINIKRKHNKKKATKKK